MIWVVKPDHHSQRLRTDGDEVCRVFLGPHSRKGKILRLPLKHSRGGKFTYVFQYGSFILSCFFLLAFRSLTRRYHIVHAHNMPDILVFAALVPKICGAKVILDLHDPMPELMMTI